MQTLLLHLKKSGPADSIVTCRLVEGARKPSVSNWHADMAILGRRRFNARLLTSIIKSAAALKFDDEALTDKISENLLQRIDKLDDVEVTDLVSFQPARL